MNPGSVSSADRAPPPTVSRASKTQTDQPARAISMAAAKPFGPEPTTTASNSISVFYMPLLSFRPQRRVLPRQTRDGGLLPTPAGCDSMPGYQNVHGRRNRWTPVSTNCLDACGHPADRFVDRHNRVLRDTGRGI